MPGAAASTCCSAWPMQRGLQLDEPATRSGGRGRAGRAAGRWRPGRCGCGRRAACRRGVPRRSSRPRSSAVCTSSSATVGPEVARPRTAASGRPARRASRCELVVVEQAGAGAAPGRARARPAGRTGASRQSKCTLTDSAASASDGPPSNRPPHSGRRLAACSSSRCSSPWRLPAVRTSFRLAGRRFGRARSCSAGPTARRSPWPGLVERVAGVVGRELEVVQRRAAAPAGDDGAAAVQGHPDVAGDVLAGPRR